MDNGGRIYRNNGVIVSQKIAVALSAARDAFK